MTDWIKKQFQKYRDVILYLFFGGCTTVLNIAVYYLCYNIAGIPNVPSTCIAWILSVLFAYLTNRKWVFHSEAAGQTEILKEIIRFFAARLATGIFDWVFMYVPVDRLAWPDVAMKVIANIVVIVGNYVLSKVLVFKKKKEASGKET